MTLNIKYDVPLSSFCTFGIGGAAKYFAEAQNTTQLQELFSFCQDRGIPFFILGKGSNCLFEDRGFEGMVICNKINFCQQKDCIVHVGAGYSFALLGKHTAAKGFSGLEFASGIPATVGGAIFMNAGASKQEASIPLVSVEYMHANGDVEVFEKEQMQFGYRYSCFQNKQGAITSAKFQLTPQANAKETQKNLLQYRIQTQPYSEKSAGCIFRNPTAEMSAGALIDACGLKGGNVLAAEVSQHHANFIVNKGDASCADVVQLIQIVQQKVAQKFGVQLETEIRQILYDGTVV